MFAGQKEPEVFFFLSQEPSRKWPENKLRACADLDTWRRIIIHAVMYLHSCALSRASSRQVCTLTQDRSQNTKFPWSTVHSIINKRQEKYELGENKINRTPDELCLGYSGMIGSQHKQKPNEWENRTMQNRSVRSKFRSRRTERCNWFKNSWIKADFGAFTQVTCSLSSFPPELAVHWWKNDEYCNAVPIWTFPIHLQQNYCDSFVPCLVAVM